LRDDDPSWFIPSIVYEFPDVLKSSIIDQACRKLESAKNCWVQKNLQQKERELQQSSIIMKNPPFVTVLLHCLTIDRFQDRMLSSLYVQIANYVQNARETEDRVPDDLRVCQILQECLQLRLGLVGHLFPRIQENVETCSDWCVLFTQLITFGVVEEASNRSLFFTVLDMLTTLIHLIYVIGENDNCFYKTSKKLLKEIKEKSLVEGNEYIKVC